MTLHIEPDVAWLSTAPEPDPPLPEPDSSVPEPDSTVPEPDSSVPEPVEGTPEPHSSVPEPVEGTPEPDTPVPEPVEGTAPGIALAKVPDGRPIVLSGSSALVWRELVEVVAEGGVRADVVRRVRELVEADPAEVGAGVETFLDELVGLGVLRETQSSNESR